MSAKSGLKTVTAAGTAEALGSGQVHGALMVKALSGNAGLVYKNRHGKYSFAVPLLGRFILRQQASTGL